MGLALRGRGKKYYISGFYQGQRCFFSTGLDTTEHKEAERRRVAVQVAILEGRDGRAAARGLDGGEVAEVSRFGAVALAYLAAKQRSKGTRSMVAKLCDWWEGVDVEAIDEAMWLRYVAQAHVGNTGATVGRELRQFRAVLQAAVRQKRLGSVPEIEMPGDERKRVRWLTKVEIRRLRWASDAVVRPLFVFLIYSGARLGEATRLRWGDVMSGEVILSDRKGKGGVWRERTVPMHEQVQVVMRAMRRAFFAEMGYHPEEDDLVFVRPGGQGWGDRPGSTVRYYFEKAKRKAGFGSEVSVHVLRHTFASQLRQRGVELDVLRELLGHEDIQTTMRYAHIGRVALRDAVTRWTV
jgi:site-specific recombinase XerD